MYKTHAKSMKSGNPVFFSKIWNPSHILVVQNKVWYCKMWETHAKRMKGSNPMLFSLSKCTFDIISNCPCSVLIPKHSYKLVL